jgi:hypothetical protein
MSRLASERMLRRLYQPYVVEKDRLLLDLLFNPSPTQQELNTVLNTYDINVLGAVKALPLSHLMREHPELDFFEHTAQIRGLADYFRFANARILSHFSTIGKALNAADIPILIFKGAAMKVLQPERCRPMSDVDIVVPPERMAEAADIYRKIGYYNERTGIQTAVTFMHSTNYDRAVDIHSTPLEHIENANAFYESMLARAREIKAYGVRMYLPSHEDLTFMILASLTRILPRKVSCQILFYALSDFRFLIADKPDFDWTLVHENIKITNTELPVGLGAKFMNSLVPGIVPDIDDNLPFSSKMEAYCNQIIFDEDYFHKRKAVCLTIRVVDMKYHPWRYGIMILKFLLLKRFRNCPTFIRWYLRTREAKLANG